MVEGLMKLVAKELRRLADKFDAGTTEASESQVMDILNMLTHVPMSKAQACSYLNLSRRSHPRRGGVQSHFNF